MSDLTLHSPDKDSAPYVLSIDSDLDNLVAFRRGEARRGEYTPLGVLSRMMIEPAAVPAETANRIDRASINSITIDWWMAAHTRGKENGVLIALSNTGEILCVGPVSPPPKYVPDPNWTHSGARQRVKGFKPQFAPLKKEKPEMVKQSFLDHATGTIFADASEWLVIQPVQTLHIRALDRGGWNEVNFSADGQGRHTAFLYNLETLEGHFVFGKSLVQLAPLSSAIVEG